MPHVDGSEEVFKVLEACLIERRISAGFQALDEFLKPGASLPQRSSFRVPILFCLVQWIDLGYKIDSSVDDLLESFAPQDHGSMSTRDFLQLRMVQAFACLRRQEFARAILLLETTMGSGEGILTPYQTFVANFWMGRAQRLAGDFERSLLHIRRAYQGASEMNAPKLVAVTCIHESWLVFHQGEYDGALKLLDAAEKELLPTGHALSLANISAARGRFVRSSGHYADAFKHFARAIEIYSANHGDHPNLARALVNAAYVKRLMALEHRPKSRGARAKAATHELSQKLAKEALALLDRAAEIYRNQHHQGGTGAVLVHTGYLHLETGDIEQAATAASKAYELGEEKADQMLMARARILQGLVELACCEEQMEEQSELETHSSLAARHAEQAIQLAGKTQNRRLLAAAYIVRGLIAADESNQDWALARSYAVQAAALMGEHDRDHLYRELLSLNLKISRSDAIDEMMRAWCNGEISGKSFQQVEDEFAQIVIPKVWIRLDRKVSRVAEELSISPKKVRRILRAARHISDPES